MQPNILFFLADQHRADWGGWNLSLPLRTPHLDGLARSGVRFSHAVTPSPLCAPARACLASGQAYPANRVRSNRDNYPLHKPTIYQALRDVGYWTCGVGKLDLRKDGGVPHNELNWNLDGSSKLHEWGFADGCDSEGKLDASASYRASGCAKGPYMAFLANRGLAETYCEEHTHRRHHRDAYVTALPDDAYIDNWIADNGLRHLNSCSAHHPWFLMVNLAGPHNPMDVTASMEAAWRDVDFPGPVGADKSNYSMEDHQRNRRHYAAMIENVDRLIGQFLEALQRRGEMDRTVVIYSSDHGEMLGDYGLWGKSTWHSQATDIPLIVSGPGVQKGKSSEALVSLHDVGATILDWAGHPGLPDMEALSFRPVLEGKSTFHRETVTSALKNWRMTLDQSGNRQVVEG